MISIRLQTGNSDYPYSDEAGLTCMFFCCGCGEVVLTTAELEQEREE